MFKIQMWQVKNGLWIYPTKDNIWGKGIYYELWMGEELVGVVHEVDLKALGLAI